MTTQLLEERTGNPEIWARVDEMKKQDSEESSFKWKGERFTDTANADRLVKRHGQNIRYVMEWKDWAVWNGCRWEPDTDAAMVTELAKETAASIYAEAEQAARAGRTEAAEALGKFATRSLNQSMLFAMVKLARSDERVKISVKDMDTDKYLLNCPNGTVNLRTGELQSPRREDLITKVTGVEYNPDAECERWEHFIDWATCQREDLVDFIWLALGYSLTGDVSERLIFFLHGEGWNGKSTMLDVFRYVLGDYAMRVQSKLIEATKFRSSASSASPEIAQLKGARFLSTSEVEDGTKLATTLLKDLTGKENLSGRFLFKNLVEFRPEFKPWISANHLPDAPADDQAIWDRLRLVPFDNRIGPNDPNYNKHLDEDLKQVESTGILAWAVQGCLEWQRTGMTKPKCVIAATDDYRAQMDYFKDFLAYVNESQWIELTPTPLRQSFMEWCKTTGTRAELTQRQFKKAMEEHGWTQSPSSTREWQPPEEQ